MVSLEHYRSLPSAAESEASRLAGLRCFVAEDEAELSALESDWNRLFAESKSPSLCASHAWATAWWQTFRTPGKKLYVVAVRDHKERLVALFPFFEERNPGPFGVRRLRLIGDLGRDGVFGMTEEPILLVEAGWDKLALAQLSAHLRPFLRAGRWDLVFIRAFQEGKTCPYKEVLQTLRSFSIVRCDGRPGSDYCTMPDSWAQYRKVLSKSMRDNLGYYPRLLTRDGHDWQVRYIHNAQEMPAAAGRLAALHQARADSNVGQRHCSHIHGPIQERFLATLLEGLAKRNGAFIAELVVDGEVVASQAFIESGDELMVYYSGYLDSWYKYSPIFVIDAVVFKDALERGVRRLDFLRNLAPWKTRWGAECGPELSRVGIVPMRPDCLARFGLHFVGQAIKKNVIDRWPTIRQKTQRRIGKLLLSLKSGQQQSAKVLLPLVPLASRFGTRAAPVVHCALRLPLHHR